MCSVFSSKHSKRFLQGITFVCKTIDNVDAPGGGVHTCVYGCDLEWLSQGDWRWYAQAESTHWSQNVPKRTLVLVHMWFHWFHHSLVWHSLSRPFVHSRREERPITPRKSDQGDQFNKNACLTAGAPTFCSFVITGCRLRVLSAPGRASPPGLSSVQVFIAALSQWIVDTIEGSETRPERDGTRRRHPSPGWAANGHEEKTDQGILKECLALLEGLMDNMKQRTGWLFGESCRTRLDWLFGCLIISLFG